jgi:uncharacterized protein (DUF427 family)
VVFDTKVEEKAMPADKSVSTEPCEKRVRAYFAGELVFDTIHAQLVRNLPNNAAYFVPLVDVRKELIRVSGKTEESNEGPIEYYDIVVGDKVAENAAWRYPESKLPELRDRIRFDWYAMDGWFEEDEEVFFHPRLPNHRVDICPSSRHVEVFIDGVKVADSTHARFLFETNCPTRYYLPLTDVRQDLLRSTDTVTRCPYKGYASYWSVDVNGHTYKDVVWSYKNPFYESLPIAGLAGFWNEKLEIYVDGVLDSRSPARVGS